MCTFSWLGPTLITARCRLTVHACHLKSQRYTSDWEWLRSGPHNANNLLKDITLRVANWRNSNTQMNVRNGVLLANVLQVKKKQHEGNIMHNFVMHRVAIKIFYFTQSCIVNKLTLTEWIDAPHRLSPAHILHGWYSRLYSSYEYCFDFHAPCINMFQDVTCASLLYIVAY